MHLCASSNVYQKHTIYLASYPGHSQFFNVATLKNWEWTGYEATMYYIIFNRIRGMTDNCLIIFFFFLLGGAHTFGSKVQEQDGHKEADE